MFVTVVTLPLGILWVVKWGRHVGIETTLNGIMVAGCVLDG